MAIAALCFVRQEKRITQIFALHSANSSCHLVEQLAYENEARECKMRFFDQSRLLAAFCPISLNKQQTENLHVDRP